MAEWLLEHGIGEDRAVLVEDGEIIEAAIEIHGALRVGDIVPARLTHLPASRRRGVATLEGGGEAIVEPLPEGLTEGATFNAEIIREPIPEEGRHKSAKVQATDSPCRRGPSLKTRLGRAMTIGPMEGDRFEAGGWSDLLEQAAHGEIAFPGGKLRMSLTPAMTLFDVDGDLPAAALAEAGGAAAARAIRRFGVGGSIGLDLPTVADRSTRQAAAAAVDRLLPQPFERTAVNGFGFLQIVRRRDRPSIPEMIRADPVGAATRALLRRAERCPGHGALAIDAHPSVIARLESEGQWLEVLKGRVGAAVALRPQPRLAISAGHVQRQTL